jgi:hypothetical protein
VIAKGAAVRERINTRCRREHNCCPSSSAVATPKVGKSPSNVLAEVGQRSSHGSRQATCRFCNSFFMPAIVIVVRKS